MIILTTPLTFRNTLRTEKFNFFQSTALERSKIFNSLYVKKVKWYRYRPGVAQRVGRGIALLFHDHGTSRGWSVSSMPRPHFTPGKDPVLILQEAGWTPVPVCTGEKSRPQRDTIPDRPTSSQSLYRLRYPAHNRLYVYTVISLKIGGEKNLP